MKCDRQGSPTLALFPGHPFGGGASSVNSFLGSIKFFTGVKQTGMKKLLEPGNKAKVGLAQRSHFNYVFGYYQFWHNSGQNDWIASLKPKLEVDVVKN